MVKQTKLQKAIEYLNTKCGYIEIEIDDDYTDKEILELYKKHKEANLKEQKEPEEKRVHDTGEDDFIKEEYLNKLKKPKEITIDQDSILENAEIDFSLDDKSEPFINREYAEETKRIYGLLKNKASMGDFDSPQDRAIFDIVEDIFRGVENQLNN